MLHNAARSLRHRGPDHSEVYADGNIGLVHTRLSLLDLSARSNQPFWDQSKRFALVYNGEIYNFLDIRKILESRGLTFVTMSDTEVLLAALIHLGVEETLDMLEGMFAFALYDRNTRSFTLARDRLGIKPLYTYETDSIFIFTSEIHVLRGWAPLEPDMLSIAAYLDNFTGPTSGRSFYRDVQIVPPGSLISVHPGQRANYSRYFHVSDLWDIEQRDALQNLAVDELVDKADELLFESVRKQLIADAPVGALCSGGVDSSLIMAMASRLHDDLAIFHANVSGPDSEYEAAVSLARHLKLDLKSVKVQPDDVIRTMPDVTRHYGHPFFIHPNSIPFLEVSRLVQKHGVKAILSGEGSDECYNGYPWLVPDLEARLRNPHREVYGFLSRAMKKLLHGDSGAEEGIPGVQGGWGVLSRFESTLENERFRKHIEQISGGKVDRKDLITVEMLGYYIRTLLHRNDCLGMAASIEARFPFLDNALVKLAVNLPYGAKVRFSPRRVRRADRRTTRNIMGFNLLTDKWIIRKVADRYLPPDLSRRQKIGFPMSAAKNLQVADVFYKNSAVMELLNLGSGEMKFLLEKADSTLKLKLLHLEVWAHVCLYDLERNNIDKRLRDYVTN